MHDAMNCFIQLHKICVEDREGDNDTHFHGEPFSAAVIGSYVTPLWSEQGKSGTWDCLGTGSELKGFQRWKPFSSLHHIGESERPPIIYED